MICLGVDPGADAGWALINITAGMATYVGGGVLDTRDEADVARLFSVSAEALSLVAVESVSRVFPRSGKTGSFGTNMATHIARAAEIGGMVIGYAKAHGIATMRCEANEWRQALGAGRGATDAAVKRALMMRIRLPTRTSAHVRDAVGVALFASHKARIEELAKRRTA